MCVYSAYMSRVIAEYELHEPEKVRMRVGEIGAGEKRTWYARAIAYALVRNWRTWCIVLVSCVLYYMQVSDCREWQQIMQMELTSIYLSDRIPDVEEGIDVVERYMDRVQDLRVAYEITADVIFSLLLVMVCRWISSYIILLRYPYCAAMSVGLKSADVMRLTERGCLLVGRGNGLRMFFPWADYKSFRVGARYLSLVRDMWDSLALPLPELSAEQQESLRARLAEAFARQAGKAGTQPPASAHSWKARKLAPCGMGDDVLASDAGLCKMIACAYGAMVALCLLVMWQMGSTPRIILATSVSLLLGCRYVGVALLSRRAWRYECRRERYVVYPTFGGVCSVPWKMVRDIVLLKYQDSLRLKNDAYAMLPCINWWQGVEPLQDMPRTKVQVKMKFLLFYYLMIIWILVIGFWNIIPRLF